MEGPLTGLAVFACLMLSSLLGAGLHARMRGSLVVRGLALLRGMSGVVAVISAIFVVGMVVSLKASFDSTGHEVRHFSVLVVDLDRSLRRLGPDADAARELLFRYADRVMHDTWRDSGRAGATSEPTDLLLLGELEAAIAAVPATTAPRRQTLADARALLQGMVESRWSLEERTGLSLPPYTLPVAIFWMMLSFGSIGVLARHSNLAVAMLMLGAVGVGGAVFLLEEYENPFAGVIVVSSEPVENALFTMTD